jgi:peptidoglycan-associated lipoprotein
MSHFKLITLVVFGVVLAGCSQKTIPDPDPTDATYGADETMGASTSGMDGADPYGGESFGQDPTAGELTMVIYFEFDSSEVRPEDQDLVARHAMQAGNNPGMRVRLEGHADERGSREYNIGLGERRAQAVRRMLMIQGVPADQISTVSFGEERPVAFGSSEEDYAQNRRVEFKYVN